MKNFFYDKETRKNLLINLIASIIFLIFLPLITFFYLAFAHLYFGNHVFWFYGLCLYKCCTWTEKLD